MLLWTLYYCKDVKLLFKLDDDSFVIPKRFTKWLQNFNDTQSWPVNSIIGRLHFTISCQQYNRYITLYYILSTV